MRRPQFLLALALLVLAPPVEALTCSVVALTPVAFGAYDPTSPSPRVGTGRITLGCQDVAAADMLQVSLSAGGAASVSRRRMTSATSRGILRYNLYLDPARTRVWGDGTAGSVWRLASPHPAFAHTRFVVPVYAAVTAAQNVPAGAYGDTIVVTLIY